MNCTTLILSLPGKALRRFCLLCLLAAVSGSGFCFFGPVQAQEGTGYEYVDLIVTYEYDSEEVAYRVRNIGTAKATGVTVSFLLEDLQTNTFSSSSSITTTEEGTNQRFTWEVGTISPGETSIELKFSTVNHSAHTTWNRIGVTTATASSIQHEPDFLLANNITKVYSYPTSSTGSAKHMKDGLLALLLSVDNLRPDAGGNVIFGLTASRSGAGYAGDIINLIGEIEIKVELSDGLKFKADWTPTAADKFEIAESRQSATWTPEEVDVHSLTTIPHSREVSIQVQLTSDNLDDIPRKERCITASVEDSKPPPNPDYALGSLKQCLGDDPTVLFNQEKADLFTIYPCAGVSPIAYPCRDEDGTSGLDNGLEIVASASFEKYLQTIRSSGIGRFDQGSRIADYGVRLRPESVVVQVKDPEGRVVVSGSSSWQTGLSWQTAGGSGSATGFTAHENLDLAHSAGTWTNAKDRVTATGPELTENPGNFSAKPGTLSIRTVHCPSTTICYNELANADNAGFSTAYPFGDASGSYSTDVFYELSTLGTYLTKRSFKGTHSSTEYTAHASFTIHVGPIAELEVRDGGASPHAPADRNALTVFALNNGPDRSLGARVTGLPKGAEVLHISQGSYDRIAGEWNTGEMEDSHLLRARGFPGHATLVLSASAGNSHKVAIENSVNYKVCIDSDGADVDAASEPACTATTGNTWHTTPVYDYDDGNNTATITAARGTGGVGPGIPANPRAQTGATGVMWDKVGLLYGLPVERYEVQWLGSDWTTLDRWVADSQYVDAAPSGRRDYRVRAVNMAGAKGPWSRSTAEAQAGNAGPPVNLRTQADGNNAIDVSWGAPEDVGGSAITSYTVQWSLDGTAEGSWSNAGSTADQTFKHRGLQTGAVRYYRVAARNRSGLGLWSDPVMGQTVSGVPDAPTLKAKTLSDYQIELTWNEPKDNGEPITGYHLERSRDGSADSWSQRVDLGADPATYADSTLDANTRYYYRVRAVNSVGGGAWSRSVSAMTQLTPPNAPSLTSVEADGPNAIVVSWAEPWYLGDLPITQYQVQWAKDYNSEVWRGPQTLSGSVRSWRHTGLKPDETWYYQVRASNGGGRWSPWSHTSATTTASDNAPKAVSGFRAQYDKDARQVNLTWNDLSGSETTFGYELERSEDGSDWDTLRSGATCDAGKCAYGDTDLWPGAKLYYRVRGVSDEGDKGPWSSAQSVSVPADPPDAPRYRWVEADGSNHIYFEWTAPYYDGGAAITGYRLLWCRALDGADDNPCRDAMAESNSPADPPGYSRISLGASAHSYTHSVSPGYNYFYLVRATNGGNRWSEWEEYDITAWVRTYAGVPAAPSLRAQSVDNNQIKLTWSKPNDYGSEISEYWLYIYENGEDLYDWDNILDIMRIQGDQTEYTLGGLDPETTRYFRIRALNDNGEGKYSALRQTTTPAG